MPEAEDEGEEHQEDRRRRTGHGGRREGVRQQRQGRTCFHLEPDSGGAKGTGQFSAVSTKFDFVPGDSVLFYDDFTQDDLGEFPSRWKLNSGTFEVAEMEGRRWLRCTSSDGEIRMKTSGIPDLWTLEFDFYGVNLQGSIALTVTGRRTKTSRSGSPGSPTAGRFSTWRAAPSSPTPPSKGRPSKAATTSCSWDAARR
jgi:hypothetical protein